MNAQKYTPGPWHVGAPITDDDGDGMPEITIRRTRGGYDLVVASAWGGWEDQEANARLIAAAPDLLEELQGAKDCIHAFISDFVEDAKDPQTGLVEDAESLTAIGLVFELMNRMDAAIAKATGREV